MARAAAALCSPPKPPWALLRSRRSMLKDVGTATDVKHLCPTQRGSRDFSPEPTSGS